MKKISVFCGSSVGNNPIYKQAAKELASLFIENHFTLLYGGAKIGLMGIIADELLKAGGTVIGIMPEFLINKEIAHTNLTQLITVNSMQERKTWMLEHSDAFIALPGGYGTLDEIFEMICFGQLQIHQKPCAFLNTNGFYNYLNEFLENAVNEGFISKKHKEMLIIESYPKMLIYRLLHYSHPVVDKTGLAKKTTTPHEKKQ